MGRHILHIDLSRKQQHLSLSMLRGREYRGGRRCAADPTALSQPFVNTNLWSHHTTTGIPHHVFAFWDTADASPTGLGHVTERYEAHRPVGGMCPVPRAVRPRVWGFPTGLGGRVAPLGGGGVYSTDPSALERLWRGMLRLELRRCRFQTFASTPNGPQRSRGLADRFGVDWRV